jgi:hypothetical protein
VSGTTLFAKGDPGTALYAVVSGTLKIKLPSIDGREVMFNLVHAGEVFWRDRADLGESRAAEPMPDFTKRGALGVPELQASIQLGFQNAVLGKYSFRASSSWSTVTVTQASMRAQSMTAPLVPTYGVIEIPFWQW